MCPRCRVGGQRGRNLGLNWRTKGFVQSITISDHEAVWAEETIYPDDSGPGALTAAYRMPCHAGQLRAMTTSPMLLGLFQAQYLAELSVNSLISASVSTLSVAPLPIVLVARPCTQVTSVTLMGGDVSG